MLVCHERTVSEQKAGKRPHGVRISRQKKPRASELSITHTALLEPEKEVAVLQAILKLFHRMASEKLSVFKPALRLKTFLLEINF